MSSVTCGPTAYRGRREVIMPDVATEEGRAIVPRVVGGLVPFIFLCYVLPISIASTSASPPELQRDLGLSDAAYGSAAGCSSLATACSRFRAT